MFPRRRAVAACLTLTFLGLCALFLHARSITPRSVAIHEIGGEDAGSSVRVRGHVHRVSTTDGGDASIVLIDYGDFATVRVVARPNAITDPTLVAPGALVDVVGTLFGSDGSLQIFSDDVGGVTVVAPAPTNLLSLEFIARNAPRLEGERVLARAAVADLRAIIDSRHARLRQGGAEVWAFAGDGWTPGPANVTGRLRAGDGVRCLRHPSRSPLTRRSRVSRRAPASSSGNRSSCGT
ncbi:MAG: hypothetical protein E6K18_05230 [Methanobacteriota archaeon]|nr:MAG: hypothetical protein E6K18_05230 [Euryarchaeota archaeon]